MPRTFDAPLGHQGRSVVLALAAAVAFVGGWVLPVVGGRRGWEAFRVALSPIWPYERFGFEAWYDAALTIASALTNVVFVLAFVDAFVVRRVRARTLTIALLAAAAVDLHWLVRAGAQFTQLQLGYYVWLAAFPLLALAAHAARR